MNEEEEESRKRLIRGAVEEVRVYNVDTEPRSAEGSEEEERSGISVTMVLPTEIVLDVRFLREYLQLPTRADAVTAAISISSLLLREIKQGGAVFVESRAGSKSRLSLGRKSDAE